MKKLILLALPLLMMSCSDEDSNPDGTRTPTAPILFETTGMTWHTVYDEVNNIYTTTMTYGEVDFIVKENSYFPNEIVVAELTKEEDGVVEKTDVSEIKKLVMAGNEFYSFDSGDLVFNYTEKGKLSIELKSNENRDNPAYEYRHYTVKLQDKEGDVETAIIINDKSVLYQGIFPMDLELNEIGYPAERKYDEWSGYYKGFDYVIKLPAEASSFSLVSVNNATCMSVKNFTVTNTADKTVEKLSTPYYDVQNFPVEYSFTTSCGEFKYIKKIHEYYDTEEKTSKNYNECILHCNILENTSDNEREIDFEIDGGMHMARIKLIQVAK